jgi:hypothetical protein
MLHHTRGFLMISSEVKQEWRLTGMCFSTVQCSAVQCSAMQCSAVQCRTGDGGAQCSAVQWRQCSRCRVVDRARVPTHLAPHTDS